MAASKIVGALMREGVLQRQGKMGMQMLRLFLPHLAILVVERLRCIAQAFRVPLLQCDYYWSMGVTCSQLMQALVTWGRLYIKQLQEGDT
jgi:hypothetical protein